MPGSGAGFSGPAAPSPWMSFLPLFLGIGGATMAAGGAARSAQQQQYELRSRALGYDFAAKMAELNARMVDMQARYVVQAGRREAMVVGLRAGQMEGTARATMAARGLDLGVGTPPEILTTSEMMKEIDLLTINSNTSREVAAVRAEAASYRSQAIMDRASATNLRGSAGLIDPRREMVTSLLGSASQLSAMWLPYLMR